MSQRIADQARAALRRHVIDSFVPRCVDRQYGGFLVDFDERWRPVGPHDKTLEHASRTTLAFALMARALPGEGHDELVRHGCAFLQSALWDAQHGGFFAQVDRSGRPCWEGLKHPHAVTYTAEAFLLAEPFLPAGEGRAWAGRALTWLDDVAWDPTHGGYWGSFRQDNERYTDDAQLPTPDGRDVLGLPPGFKELNTLGDAMDMLAMFAAHGDRGRCAERLAWYVDLVTERLTDRAGVLPYLFRPDWRPVPDVVRIGQHFQMVHRLLAAAAISGSIVPVVRSREIGDFCLASARHPAGGFCFAVSGTGRTWPTIHSEADLRHWWVQFEAVRALHSLATHEGIDCEARGLYERARDQQWAFLRDHFFDTRFGGIWEYPVESIARWRSLLPYWLQPKPQGPPLVRKTHGWKDPSHEVGAFLALSRTQTVPHGKSTVSS